ncbi:RNA-directed DNA polymerase from mobile element jockey [Eumeta japonica]|uniref:RNA-directed DNA polymerase from mobile element jockey n=1 Tax=Eumeta variegata TaxID=151549 RepID=A0A4C1YYG1_EUMVA|nr:RNA-directed DNA polymerase from mobile element jockey [Eumeta japonica]
MCRPKRFTKGQRLRRRPRAGSGFALHRTVRACGRHLQGHQGNGKPGGYPLQTDSGLVLSPNESATLLAETFFPDDWSILTIRITRKSEGKPTGMIVHPQLGICPGGPTFTGAEVAAIKVIPKPGKDDYARPESYRPIGLLPVLGKTVERMLVGRLQWHLMPKLQVTQYGFMPQRGAEDALYDLMTYIYKDLNLKKIVLMVSLDIEGAFDNAWWPALKAQLTNARSGHKTVLMIQANLQRSKLATAELLQLATEKGISIALIQDPYVGNRDILQQNPDTKVIQCTVGRQKPVKAAIIVFGDKVDVLHDSQLVTETESAVLLKIGRMKLGIISIYFEGDEDIEPYIIRTKKACKNL